MEVHDIGAAFRLSWSLARREIERLGGNPREVVHPATGEIRLFEFFGPPENCERLGLAVSQDWDPVPGGLCDRSRPGKAGPLGSVDKTRKPREVIQ